MAKKKNVKKSGKKLPQAKQKQKALKMSNRGYVSSYLDLSVKTPGKYGVDY